MILQEVIKILEEHNKWRRDKNSPSIYKETDPKKLGKAIDIAVDQLKMTLEYYLSN